MTQSFIGFGDQQSCKPRLQYGVIPSSFSSREMLAYQREIMEVCEDNPFVIAFIRWPHGVLPLLVHDGEVAAIMHHLLTPACSRPRSCSNRENYSTVTRQPPHRQVHLRSIYTSCAIEDRPHSLSFHFRAILPWDDSSVLEVAWSMPAWRLGSLSRYVLNCQSLLPPECVV